MGIARSTFYDQPTAGLDDTAIVEAIAVICDEFEFYGWRRVRAELQHRGMIVNHKKIRRLTREHDLQPRRRRRYVATTDSDHDLPIYPNRTKDLTIDGSKPSIRRPTKPSPMSLRTFRSSSTRSTTGAVSIPLWAISARNSSRTATPGLRSNQQPDRCPPRGAHSSFWGKFNRH